MDFFLTLKKIGRWKVALCENAEARHLDPSRLPFDPDYLAARRAGSHPYFLQKWGLDTVLKRY
jgi:hypothetical protein